MSQWSNFLGSDVSVLELALAAASVGGGGYIGGRVTSLSRMRTDDRRRLVDELIPQLIERLSNYPTRDEVAEELYRAPMYSHGLDMDLDTDALLAVRTGSWAQVLLNDVTEIGRLVDRLSWFERQLTCGEGQVGWFGC